MWDNTLVQSIQEERSRNAEMTKKIEELERELGEERSMNNKLRIEYFGRVKDIEGILSDLCLDSPDLE